MSLLMLYAAAARPGRAAAEVSVLRKTAGAGAGEDLAQRAADALDVPEHGVPVEPPPSFVPDIDDPTGIDDIVGSVEDAAFHQGGAVTGFRELIVGGAGDDAGSKVRDRHVVQNCAHGAWREDVDVDVEAVDLVGRDGGGAEGIDGPGELVAVDVGHPELGAGLMKQPGKLVADAADALDGDAQAAQIVPAEPVPDGGTHADEGAEGGCRRRIAVADAAVRRLPVENTGYVPGLLGHQGRVTRACRRRKSCSCG